MEGNNIAMATTEEEIELELGLSIGGSYRRHARNGNVLKSEISKDMGCSETNECCIVRSSVSPCLIGDAMQELGPKTKREMHALRRKEAKKKREEKQLKKGLCKGYSLNSSQLSNNNGGGEINNNFKNNGVWLKAKDFRISNSDERECKKIKIKAVGSDHNDDMNLNKANGKNNNSAYLPLQYGLPANGFVYPCGNVNINVMPCWFTAVSEERNAVPVVSYGFVPFQGGSGPGYHLGNGYDSEHNCGLDGGGNTKAGSNVSPLCTSFTSSDRRSSSHEGGGSSYTRSHSSPSVPEQSQLKAIETRGVSEHSETSHPGPVNESTNQVEETIQSNRDQSSPTAGPKLEPKSETESDSTEKHVSTLENPNSLEDKNKPQSENHIPPPLPHMPCVSTTGNGPNGKTINGFLYRYTKTEVSIICVCHGNSFTPAEFVQHAGGTDVSHPLRHITVIPSAF